MAEEVPVSTNRLLMAANSLVERCTGLQIPTTAVEVDVHSVENPSSIRVSNVNASGEKMDAINNKLQAIVRQSGSLRQTRESELKRGTLAIVYGRISIHLPAWYCRAIIGPYNPATSEYLAFLPDWGNYVELSAKAFFIPPEDIESPPFATFLIGLDKVWPAERRRSPSGRKFELVLQKTWSAEAMDITTQLINSASKYFFDQTSTKGSEIRGELYLLIDDQIVPLGRALSVAQQAVSAADLGSSEDSTTPTSTSGESDEQHDLTESAGRLNAAKSISHEILVCSDMKCTRLSDIHEAHFDEGVMKALGGLEIKTLRQIQSYVWPAINKGLDVLSVGPSHGGKTIGYAAPIASILAYTKKYQRDSTFPMVLVLCASSNAGRHIESRFKRLLVAHPDLKVVGAFNGCSDCSLAAMIYNGCHVFISTPAFLLRFFEREESHRRLLRFDGVNHLVVDNLDVLLEKHSASLTQVLRKHTPFAKKQSRCSLLALQIVAAAQHWTAAVGSFLRGFTNPYVVIGSFAEAAIFCGVQLRPRILPSDRKKSKLLQILDNHYKMVKTVVVCATDKEVDDLHEFLAAAVQILFINGRMDIHEVLRKKEEWDASPRGMHPVLLCTDFALLKLNVRDAAWLIHYSLAVPTKTDFLYRFSTLMVNLKLNAKKVEVTILIDDTNDVQLRGIMDLIVRSGYIVPQNLLQAIERIYVTLERKKKDHPICNNVKALGVCPKRQKCLYRHCVLLEVDEPMTPVKIGDLIKLTVTYVHNATHFSARLLEYTDEHSQRHELSEIEHIKVSNQVHQYFSDKSKRRVAQKVVVGGVYGFEETLDVFARVQVICIFSVDEDDEASIVDVRCIDKGNVINHVKASRLKDLSEELAKAPGFIVEIFLANVLPYDAEDEWSTEATDACTAWFREELILKTTFLQGKVCLHLGNTIWVDPLESRSKISGGREIINSSLKQHLIEKKFGVENIKHIADLQELCMNAGMIIDSIDDENLD